MSEELYELYKGKAPKELVMSLKVGDRKFSMHEILQLNTNKNKIDVQS